MQTRSSVRKTPQLTPLRRSPRLLSQKNPTKSLVFNAQEVKSEKNPSRSTGKVSKKPIQRGNASSHCLTYGLRRSPRLNGGSLSNKSEGSKFVETNRVESRKSKGKQGGGLLEEEKKEVERKESEISVGFKAVAVERRKSGGKEVCKRNEDAQVKRKKDEGGDGNVQGWTREQELALQRAYYAAKPTPTFWKKVSKLVPGKSAQDCFNKIHSDHLTPIQPQPRSRAKKINVSPIECLSFSASKLLKPTAARTKRSSCNKQKSHLAQRKTVRHLLQKHYHLDQGDEADLFSILEPDTSPSMHGLSNTLPSTPKNMLEKQGFLQRCLESSSSLKKNKHCSKLGNSSTGDLVSPPVLKQIKNRALHEKYIDQLHSRDAKRKAKSARSGKILIGKENRESIPSLNINEVRAAKNALVSDARFVVSKLQQFQHVDNSFDLDNFDDVGSCDDDDDDEDES